MVFTLNLIKYNLNRLFPCDWKFKMNQLIPIFVICAAFSVACKTTSRGSMPDSALSASTPDPSAQRLKLYFDPADDAVTLKAFDTDERLLKLDRCVTQTLEGQLFVVVCDEKNGRWRAKIDTQTMTADFGEARGSQDPPGEARVGTPQRFSCREPRAPICD